MANNATLLSKFELKAPGEYRHTKCYSWLENNLTNLMLVIGVSRNLVDI